jgi:hypothetical protein
MPHVDESHTKTSVTRAVTVVLSEDEWRAFMKAETDPVGYLRACIRQRLAAAAGNPPEPNPTS